MRQDQYKDVLQNRLILQLDEWFTNGEPYIFMQDGAPCHTARCIKAFLAEQNIPLLDWPALKKNNSRVESSSSDAGDRVQSSIDSMPRRIEALIVAKGG
ncbi:uncharacterized protein TNCV_3530151 [Trichonephila clavipes]|uniref:Uncharacterized protein n=1 Tax=Trichonephila clavipes TaxID=2585209 RepID=A0A8X6UTC6_TRICX|nr:uncharacterized protein TNCV_3530151 [Trichonephila clavipes]